MTDVAATHADALLDVLDPEMVLDALDDADVRAYAAALDGTTTET